MAASAWRQASADFRTSIEAARTACQQAPMVYRQHYLPATLTTYPSIRPERRHTRPELHVRRPNLNLNDLLRLIIKPLHVTFGNFIGRLCRF